MKDKTRRLDTLAPGDRIVWGDGPREVYGTVRQVEVREVEGAAGPVVADVTVVIDVANWPTTDANGWPRTEPATVTRTFTPDDPTVHRAYTPARREDLP